MILMSRRRSLIFLISTFGWFLAGGNASLAGDPAAGKIIFETRCHGCHAALPYTGRVGEANLPTFLANPRRFNPKTAMTFPGLRSKKDIDDVIAYITGPH
jgi:cytochrome c2